VFPCLADSQEWVCEDTELSDDDEVRRAVNRFWIKAGLIALIPIVIVVLWIWGAGKGVQIALSVTGTQNAISKSMEPYDLTFRTKFDPTEATVTKGVVYEWRLRLPCAYVTSEIGSPQAVSGPSSSADNATYAISISAEFDSDANQLTPAVLAQKNSNQLHFGIDIENSRAPVVLKQGMDCLREVEFGPLVGSSDGFKCLKTDVRCRIYTHYHRWELLLFVPKDTTLYAEPARACSLATKFLDQHTLSVE
jgi:hypothetical protein